MVQTTNKMRDALIKKLDPRQKDLVDRMKVAVKGQNLEETLRKLARNN